MKVWILLTTNLSLSMMWLISICRVSAQWFSKTWTIVLSIILGISIVQINAGEVRLVRLKILRGKNCFLPGSSLILIIPRKNPKCLWLWDSTQRGIFFHRLCQKHWNWLLRYEIFFGTRGVWRGHSYPSRLRMTWVVYFQYGNTCNYLLKEVWKRNWIQRLTLAI